jgi:dihydroorotate dehydrogenase
MGFNNDGVDQLIENVKASKFKGILGINIGKNADTPVENAVDDYLICLKKFITTHLILRSIFLLQILKIYVVCKVVML